MSAGKLTFSLALVAVLLGALSAAAKAPKVEWRPMPMCDDGGCFASKVYEIGFRSDGAVVWRKAAARAE